MNKSERPLRAGRQRRIGPGASARSSIACSQCSFRESEPDEKPASSEAGFCVSALSGPVARGMGSCPARSISDVPMADLIWRVPNPG